MAASLLSSKSKLPWRGVSNNLTGFAIWIDGLFNVEALEKRIRMYLKIRKYQRTLGSASKASLVGAKRVKGLWPASRLVSVENATPRAFTWA